jgi:phosphoribosyl 1,2-cyclic phosphodiesterase
MKIKFWGVRGSIPAPITPDQVEQKITEALLEAGGKKLHTPQAVHRYIASLPLCKRRTIGGNTSCIEVQADGQFFIFDCGSGLRELGLRLMREEFGKGKGTANIFMTHTHWDHIVGFPFFVPAFIPGNRFTIHGVHDDLKRRFQNQHHPYNFPVPIDIMASDIQFVKLTDRRQRRFGNVRIRPFELNHPGRAFGYRIEHEGKVFIYASDSSYNQFDDEHMKPFYTQYRGCDVLAFDAYFGLKESFEKADWGHSTPFVGVDIALQAGVKKLILCHHAPAMDDESLWRLFKTAEDYMHRVSGGRACEIELACEGMELEL